MRALSAAGGTCLPCVCVCVPVHLLPSKTHVLSDSSSASLQLPLTLATGYCRLREAALLLLCFSDMAAAAAAVCQKEEETPEKRAQGAAQEEQPHGLQ